MATFQGAGSSRCHGLAQRARLLKTERAGRRKSWSAQQEHGNESKLNHQTAGFYPLFHSPGCLSGYQGTILLQELLPIFDQNLWFSRAPIQNGCHEKFRVAILGAGHSAGFMLGLGFACWSREQNAELALGWVSKGQVRHRREVDHQSSLSLIQDGLPSSFAGRKVQQILHDEACGMQDPKLE